MMLAYLLFLFVVLTSQSVYSQQFVGDNCRIQRTSESGICTILSECSEASRRLTEQRVRPTICGFQGRDTIVCCPSGEVPRVPRPTTRPRPTQTQKRISERKCEEYSSAVVRVVEALPLLPDADTLSFTVSQCNYSNVPLIVGGEETNVGEFPHMAAIGWRLSGRNEHLWQCGGSLISENFVLTAGHCIFSRDANLATREPTMVRLGDHNLKSDSDNVTPQDIPIDRIIKHPEYKPPAKYNDIALLRLTSPAKLNNNVRPACLWQKPTFSKQTAIATGWGKINYAEEPSDVLRRVSINIIDQNTCVQLYSGRNRFLLQGIAKEQLCAGDLDGGKDTCQGDSGGPLQVTENNNMCIFYIMGVTSFGSGCGGKNTPGVYTRVSSYIDWIESTLWPTG